MAKNITGYRSKD